MDCLKGKPLVNKNSKGIAVHGYDVVNYFLKSKAQKGSHQYFFDWQGARWLFASAYHRDLFAECPEKYAPIAGGYCAFAVMAGGIADINGEAWDVIDNKLYLNNNKLIRLAWLARQDHNTITQQKWASMVTAAVGP